MKLHYPYRDTILVVGSTAAGKTYVHNTLRDMAEKMGYPHNIVSNSDAQTIKDRVKYDDEHGGYGHYHPWNKGKQRKHSHEHGEPFLPFTLAYDNTIAHAMIRDFFIQLRDIPYDGRIQFAEWAIGRNINPPDEPASRVDLSCSRIRYEFENNTIPAEGFYRVIAVINPVASSELRTYLNENRTVPTEDEIRIGSNSWPLDREAMNIFGEDDFTTITPLLKEYGIEHIYTITNNGDHSLDRELYRIMPPIFEGFKRDVESQLRGWGKER